LRGLTNLRDRSAQRLVRSLEGPGRDAGASRLLADGGVAVAHVPVYKASVLLVDRDAIWHAEFHDAGSTDVTFTDDGVQQAPVAVALDPTQTRARLVRDDRQRCRSRGRRPLLHLGELRQVRVGVLP
jgi:hypothetical protein